MTFCQFGCIIEQMNKTTKNVRRLSVELDPELHQRVKERAVKERVTVSAVIRKLLEEWLLKQPR